MNICFIGYGNMAKAIARGLISHIDYSLTAASPSLTAGKNNQGITTEPDNRTAVQEADIIILAVKPAQMSAVLAEILPVLPPACLLISVAAGLSLTWFAQQGINQALVRSMPNTPAAIGLGATPLIANKHVCAQQKKQAELIFSRIGITTWVSTEDEMDAFTALSGSGPAYVFLFIESLIDAAAALGINESDAKLFALQTVAGSVKLAQESNLSLNELRTKVTSPGGTTAAALNILQPQLNQLIITAMRAAKERAAELGISESFT